MPTRLTNLPAASILAGDDLLYAVVGGDSRSIAAQAMSGRNLIINGSGRINQREYVSGAATSGANQFTLDRWFVVTSGQNLSFTGNDSGRVMTAQAGGVRQVIEGANIVGGTYVLNWTGTATATVGGVARTKGETFTLTANTNVIVSFDSGTFTDVQLERGTVATPFEFRPFGQELAMCQHYAFRLLDSVVVVATTILGTARNVSVNVQFPQTMRATPTVTYTYTDLGNMNGAPSVDATKTGARFTTATFPTAAAQALGSFTNIFASAELTS